MKTFTYKVVSDTENKIYIWQNEFTTLEEGVRIINNSLGYGYRLVYIQEGLLPPYEYTRGITEKI